MTDPIADYLTRIRNASRVKKRIVDIAHSNIKLEITKILLDQGFIRGYKVTDEKPRPIIRIELKYMSGFSTPAIVNLERISRPGLRKYVKVSDHVRVKNGLGIAILSTSQGLMTNKEAKVRNLGGEWLCAVY